MFDDGTSTVMWLPDRTLTHDVPDSAIRSRVVPVDRAELEQTAGFIAGVRAAKALRRMISRPVPSRRSSCAPVAAPTIHFRSAALSLRPGSGPGGSFQKRDERLLTRCPADAFHYDRMTVEEAAAMENAEQGISRRARAVRIAWQTPDAIAEEMLRERDAIQKSALSLTMARSQGPLKEGGTF